MTISVNLVNFGGDLNDLNNLNDFPCLRYLKTGAGISQIGCARNSAPWDPGNWTQGRFPG